MVANYFAYISSALGLAVILWRLAPALALRSSAKGADAVSIDELTSIIVPARNEEKNLPTLLTSFSEMAKSGRAKFEVIVVDDQSTDLTSEVVRSYQEGSSDFELKLVSGAPRPESWAGKNWACHQGYLQAHGDFLLFTDADTKHHSRSLESAIEIHKTRGLCLLSAVPFHFSKTWWEKLMGPFHLLVFISTAAFSIPKPGRVFAIGQYLLFSRESYERQGGHNAIASSLCDDLDLAERCLAHDGAYYVEGALRIYDVRMYASFQEFIAGWRRIFRLGLRYARPLSMVEMYLVIACLTTSFRFASASTFEIAVATLALGALAFTQKKYGEFSLMGVLLLPFGIGVFVFVSLLGAVDLVLKRDLKWRERTYAH